MKNFKSVTRFALVQLVMFVFFVIGLFVLITPCVMQAWEPSPEPSIKDGRKIDRWKWAGVRWLGFHNPEDGDNGQNALVYGSQAYMPATGARWRAYKWSALRNTADGWKYRFAWAQGRIWEFTVFGKPHKAGWQMENGFNVPVLS
jgi:hypothetical protein